MSRFYGSVDGSASTSATRRGFEGIRTHARGWDLGVTVYGHKLASDPEADTFDVRISRGSNNATSYDLASVSEVGEGWLRVSVALIDGVSVFYIAPDGTRHSRKEA